MRKIATLLAALYVVVLGAQPANAANGDFVLTLNGGSQFVQGYVTLSGSSESANVKVDASGHAAFSVAPGSYNLYLKLEGFYENVAIQDQVKVNVPGALTIDLPQATFSTVQFRLPSGKSLPNVNAFASVPFQTIISGGYKFGTPVAKVVSSSADGLRIAVFGRPDTSSLSATTLMQRTVAGTRWLSIPTSTIVNGGTVEISDAAYPILNATKITAAEGSYFTMNGQILTEGQGFVGTAPGGSGPVIVAVVAKDYVVPSNGNVFGNFFRTQAHVKDGKATIAIKLTSAMNGNFLIVSPLSGAFIFPSAMIPIEVRKPKTTYKNCASLNLDFQGGVYSSTVFKGSTGSFRIPPTSNYKLYNSVKNLDRDRDGIACEVN